MPTPPDFTAGTALAAASLNKIGLWEVASKTFTSTSSAQQIDSCFTSSFDNYRVTFKGVGSTINNEFLLLRVVNGTTPETGAVYFHGYFYSNTGAAMTTAFAGSQTAWRIGLIGDTATQCAFDICAPQVAERTTLVSQVMSSASNDYLFGQFNDMVNNTTQYEGLQMYPGSGTWSGTITVYGYGKV